MANSIEFKELKEFESWKKAFRIMNQLRTDLDEKSYLDLLDKMTQNGYRLFALIEHNKIIALAGIILCVNFYNKNHVFICDFVTDEMHRSNGYGEILMGSIHKWAKEHEAEYVSLESGVQRINAHRFYENKFGYHKWCYSFRKKL